MNKIRNDIATWAHKMDQMIIDARNLKPLSAEEATVLLTYAERIVDAVNAQCVTGRCPSPPQPPASP